MKNKKLGCSLQFEELESRLTLSASSPHPEFTILRDGSPILPELESVRVQEGYLQMQSASMQSWFGTPQPFLTTAGTPSNYVTPTGTYLDGVVELTLTFAGGTARGSGTLLPTGRHILTAAHNFFDSSGNPALAATATFHLPSSSSIIGASSVNVHNTFNGNLLNGGDIAVITLAQDAPVQATRFDIYRGGSEVGETIEKSGYGRTGTGFTGSTLASGTKRDGLNRVDVLGESLNGTIYLPGTLPVGKHLVFDFDSGSAANDAGAFFQFGADVGLGLQEVSPAPGDSGGPSFIDGLVAGVTSFGQGFNGGPDVLAGTNSSFGEVAVDTRVSAYASWTDAIVDVAGAPRIGEVIVRGSNSIHAPFAFSSVDGSGLQLRTVPVAGIDTISIGFGEHVLNVSGGSLMVRGLTTTATPTLASVGGFTYDVGTHVATWKFSAPLAADQYLLTLADTVTDVVGNALDGEWTNPFSVDTTNALVSEFPSGNGVAGGAFRFVFTALPGDASLDNYVNGNDFVIWQGSLGGPGRTFAQADFTGDGTTSSADLTVWQNNSGAKLRDLVFADFNQDTVVNFLDFSILSGNYGSTTADHDDGDADGDGDVDGNDFVMLQRQRGLTLTWVA